MSTTSDIRKGCVIKHQGDLYVVASAKFVSPGKGSAFVRVRMKSITTSKSIEITYKTSETLEVVEVDNKKLQFLYKGQKTYSFMDQDSFETFELGEDIVGEDGQYLKEGLEVWAIVYEDNVVAISVPPKVKYKVIEAPEAVKGDTASSGRLMKDVKLENGLVVRAPIFIREGDTILVNTEEGEYSERVNE